MGPHCAGTPPPGHMLELVLYEARTVGERAVRILLECFLALNTDASFTTLKLCKTAHSIHRTF